LRRLLLILFLLIASCGNEEPTQSIDSAIPYVPMTVNINGILPIIEYMAAEQYKKDCYVEEYFYCPPLNETWRAIVTTDKCKDPNVVVSIGECYQILECDPQPGVVEITDCTTSDGIKGQQNVYCSKGYWEYGPCEGCEDEICDGKDNNCDGSTDEGLFPCENECGAGDAVCIDGTLTDCDAPEPGEEICDELDNDCDGDIDEGQLNACGYCGLTPEEICDGKDNDCNGLVDDLDDKFCTTACETNKELCINGKWQCTAGQPQEEVCDGEDNDCDGLIDEDLQCNCPSFMIGMLMQCQETPLECGAGRKTCECVNDDCTETKFTECLADCYWFNPTDPTCDKYKGKVIDELCNNHDDNCNTVIDEGLVEVCYNGPAGTEDVGECKPGEIICKNGQWGNYPGAGAPGQFVVDLCLGEVLPAIVDNCNGVDDNCDGNIDDDKELEETDILFIVDTSGSMSTEIQAVVTALAQFSVYFANQDKVKWGLVMGPKTANGWYDYGYLAINLTSFNSFQTQLAAEGQIINMYGGAEMLVDLLYLSLWNIANWVPGVPTDYEWNSSIYDSDPPKEHWKVDWQKEANRVVIIFSDEDPQSWLLPKITSPNINKMVQTILDINMYAFAPTSWKFAWEQYIKATPLGKWFKLKDNSQDMYNDLLTILDENLCSEE